jgi:hypothetical protein
MPSNSTTGSSASASVVVCGPKPVASARSASTMIDADSTVRKPSRGSSRRSTTVFRAGSSARDKDRGRVRPERAIVHRTGRDRCSSRHQCQQGC